MIRLYDTNVLFFYKEESFIYFYGNLGSCKLSLQYLISFIFYISSRFFFLKKKTNHNFFFFKKSNKLFCSIGSFSTYISNGLILKFGPKGKRTRVVYDQLLFFFKLGYSSRIPYLLPLNIISYPKEKKMLFYNLSGIDINSMSSTLFHILSFRLIDPYNFGGLMLRDGIFKYNNWSRKLT